MRHCVFQGVLLSASALAVGAGPPSLPVPLAVRQAAIVGATLSVVAKTGADVHVTVENTRDSPLVRCGINTPWVGGDQEVRIPAHQRATVSIPVDEARPSTRAATLEYAVFEDGYYEGNGRWFDQWLVQRTERIQDLQYWVNAFADMPRISIAEMRRYLNDRIADRESHQTYQIPRVSERVRSLLVIMPEGPTIVRPMDLLRQQVQADLITATRVPAGDVRPESTW